MCLFFEPTSLILWGHMDPSLTSLNALIPPTNGPFEGTECILWADGMNSLGGKMASFGSNKPFIRLNKPFHGLKDTFQSANRMGDAGEQIGVFEPTSRSLRARSARALSLK